MILKGSQRAGGKALAVHLLRQDDNDHIEIHSVRGFVKNNILDAFQEAYAVSRGTKCKQFLFSLSLSPPDDKLVPVAVFERAIDKIEMRLGLVNQPRAIVFHEKNGRRHAHCVWSRIDPKTMTARQMGHFKLKLVELSRELYLEHGWQMPGGLAKTEARNPLNFSLAEWQQAKRIKRDPARIKELFKKCWAMSGTGLAFQKALEARGYYLARGDRRGFVAVDWQGEIYSISRWVGVPTKLVSERLEKLEGLRSVSDVQRMIEEVVKTKVEATPEPLALQFESSQGALKEKRDALVKVQRAERKRLEERLAARWTLESIERAGRLRKGILGLWDWFTGRRGKMAAQNEQEIATAKERDAREREALINEHLKVRRELQLHVGSIARKKDREAERTQRPAHDASLVPTRLVPYRPSRNRKPDLRV